MRTQRWLKVFKNGNVETTKNQPNPSADVVIVNLNITVPDALFVRPMLQAKISVPEELVPTPIVVAPEVIAKLEKEIKVATGFTVELVQVLPDTADEAKAVVE